MTKELELESKNQSFSLLRVPCVSAVNPTLN
jgi:hypothetical protein